MNAILIWTGRRTNAQEMLNHGYLPPLQVCLTRVQNFAVTKSLVHSFHIHNIIFNLTQFNALKKRN